MNVLDDLIDCLDQPQRYERYIVALCPFHQDRRPSFFVYKDWYRCESCGKQGHPKALLAELSNKPIYVQKPKYFRNPFTGWLKKNKLAHVLKIAWQLNNDSPSEYMKNRGFAPNIQRKFGIGRRDNWITFPIRNSDDIIVGAVARTLSDDQKHKYVLPKHQDPNLLYIPSQVQITRARAVFLVFGIISSLSLATLGVGSLSTTTGTRITPSSFDNIRKLIHIIPDRGEEVQGSELAAKLGWRGRLMNVNWPDGCDDTNDLLVKYPELLQEAIHELA